MTIEDHFAEAVVGVVALALVQWAVRWFLRAGTRARLLAVALVTGLSILMYVVMAMLFD